MNPQKWIGRETEASQIRACLHARRNILLEGPVGVGKTHLALRILAEKKLPLFRIDGDPRFSEQKITGWFDPPTCLSKGFTWESFMAGPLVEAMRQGGVLFINELNRLPEGTQNVLLPALDERILNLPRLGRLEAKEGFLIIATQNPKEFVATSRLSEALLDRFELILLDYPPIEEELSIVEEQLSSHSPQGQAQSKIKTLAEAAVQLVRKTRHHPKIRRGASIRAAISLSLIAQKFMEEGQAFEEAFLSAALLALPTRIEIERDFQSQESLKTAREHLIRECLSEEIQKKKTS